MAAAHGGVEKIGIKIDNASVVAEDGELPVDLGWLTKGKRIGCNRWIYSRPACPITSRPDPKICAAPELRCKRLATGAIVASSDVGDALVRVAALCRRNAAFPTYNHIG